MIANVFAPLLQADTTLCATCTSPSTTSSTAVRTVDGMGLDYFVYDLGTYNPNAPISYTAPLNNWATPGQNFKTPVGLYNIDAAKVNTQIANMRASGMDYIVLHIFMSDLVPCKANGSCDDGFPQNWLWSELLDSSQSALRPQQASNLISILQAIRANGFRKVIIRFANYDMAQLATWDEAEYQKAWNLIANTHRLVDQQLAGGPTVAIYDLGVEAIGATGALNYVQRLWSDYVFTFGLDDTVGFSIVGDSYHIGALSWYGNVRPKIYAFDIYGDVGAGLVNAWNLLGSEKSKPIILLETYQNDLQTSNQIQGALNANPSLNLIAVTQWQNTRQIPCAGCDTNIALSSVQALGTTTQLSNYASLATKMVSDDSNSALMTFTDMSCGATTASPCAIAGHFNFSPMGSAVAYQVYVSGSDGVRRIMSCQSGGSTALPINWIVRNTIYKFEYFRVPTCDTSVAGIAPDAISTVSVR